MVYKMSSIPRLNVSGLAQLNMAMGNLEAEAQRLMVGAKRTRDFVGGAIESPEELARELNMLKGCLCSMQGQSCQLVGGRKTRRRRNKRGGQDAESCGNIVGQASKIENDLAAMVKLTNMAVESANEIINSASNVVSVAQEEQVGGAPPAIQNLDDAIEEAERMQRDAAARMSAAQEIQRAADALQQALSAQRAVLTPRAVVAMEESIQAARQSAHAQLTDGSSCDVMQIALGLLLVSGGGAALWQALNAAGQGNALGMLLSSVVSGVQSFVGGILTGLTAAINARNQSIITALRDQITNLMALGALDAGAAGAIGRVPGDSRFLTMRMARGIAYRVCSSMPKQSRLTGMLSRMGNAVSGVFRRSQVPQAPAPQSRSRQMTLEESLGSQADRRVRARSSAPGANRGGKPMKHWRMRKTPKNSKGKKRTMRKRVSKMRKTRNNRTRK